MCRGICRTGFKCQREHFLDGRGFCRDHKDQYYTLVGLVGDELRRQRLEIFRKERKDQNYSFFSEKRKEFCSCESKRINGFQFGPTQPTLFQPTIPTQPTLLFQPTIPTQPTLFQPLTQPTLFQPTIPTQPSLFQQLTQPSLFQQLTQPSLFQPTIPTQPSLFQPTIPTQPSLFQPTIPTQPSLFQQLTQSTLFQPIIPTQPTLLERIEKVDEKLGKIENILTSMNTDLGEFQRLIKEAEELF